MPPPESRPTRPEWPLPVRPTATLGFVAGLIMAVMVLARTAGSGWLVVLAACGASAVVVGVVAPAFSLMGLRAKARLPTTATLGQPASLFVTVERASRALCLRSLDPTGEPVWVQGPSEGPILVQARCRSLVETITVEWSSRAPFGLALWRRRMTIPLDAPTAFLPAPVSASLSSDGSESPEAGNYRPHAGSGTTTRSLRAFQPGDGRRLVAWPASLRAGRLLSRELEDPTTTSLALRIILSGDVAGDDVAVAKARFLGQEALAEGRELWLATGGEKGWAGKVTSVAAMHHRLAAATVGAPLPFGPAAPAPHDLCAVPPTVPQPSIPQTSRRRARRRSSARTPQPARPLRVWSTAASLAAGAAVFAQDATSTILEICFLVGIPVASYLAYRYRDRPSPWRKAAIATAALVAFGFFFSSLLYTATAPTAAQIPLAELFCWILLLHAFDAPARRDLSFTLAATVGMIAIAATLSLSSTFGWYLMVWLICALGALHATELARLESLGMLRPMSRANNKNPAKSRMRSGGARHFKWRAALPTAAAMVVVPLLALSVFAVLPSAGTAQALLFPSNLPDVLPVPTPGGLANPSLGSQDPSGDGTNSRGDSSSGRSSFGYFGFTDTLDTNVRGRPDDTNVMKVRADRPAFWRGQTFSEFDGRTWAEPPDPVIRQLTGRNPISVPETFPASPGSSSLIQTFYVQRPGPNLVFAAAEPSELYVPSSPVYLQPDGSLRLGVQLARGASYTVISNLPPATQESLRAADPRRRPVPTEVAQRYGQLLPTTDRVRELARRTTADSPTTYDAIEDLIVVIAARTRYTLNIPPPAKGVDATDDFLFLTRRGFCEQIATSLVVMARSLGIPARLAVGYTPGERNPFTGLYEVKASDAHAWAEVYFPGVGWQAFDPTADVPLAGDQATPSAIAGLAAYLNLSFPAQTPSLLAGLAAVSVAAFGVWFPVRAAVRRRRRSFSNQVTHQLERAARQARLPHETAAGFARRLGREGRFVEQAFELEQVASAVERDSFSPHPLTDHERRTTLETANHL